MTEKFVKMMEAYANGEWFQNMQINDDIRINNDWGADSIDAAILSLEIEKTYDIEFLENEFINDDGTFKTLKELNEYIDNKVKDKDKIKDED